MKCDICNKPIIFGQASGDGPGYYYVHTPDGWIRVCVDCQGKDDSDDR